MSMSLASTVSAPPAASRRQRVDVAVILRELERLYSSFKVGETFPSRRELMKRFNASEHVVRGALDEFERQGKIIRRVGRGGSIVAEPSSENNPLLPAAGANESAAIQSRTIVTIAEPDGSIFERALQLLARQTQAAEFSVNCRLMKPQEAADFVVPPAHQKPLGFLLFRDDFAPLARRLLAAGHRVVLIGGPSTEEGAGVPNVYGDHEEGAALLTEHLLKIGHRSLIVEMDRELVDSPRGAGILRAIKESGLDVKVKLIGFSEMLAWKQNPASAHDLFLGPDTPTVLLSWNDDRAIRLLTLLNSIGVRVPQDLALVGYDNMPQSAHTHPALTTVDSAIERQLNLALRLLTRPKAPSPNHSVVVTPSLIVRESSAKPQR